MHLLKRCKTGPMKYLPPAMLYVLQNMAKGEHALLALGVGVLMRRRKRAA